VIEGWSLNAKLRNRIGMLFLFLSDLTFIFTVLYISILLRTEVLSFPVSNRISTRQYLWIIPLWFLVFIYKGVYTKRVSFWDEVKMIWKSICHVAVAIFTVVFLGKLSFNMSRSVIVSIIFFSFLFFPYWRILSKRLIYSAGLMKRRAIIVGANGLGTLALKAIQNEPNLGYEIVGFVDDVSDTRRIEGIKVHRYLKRIEKYISCGGITDIIFAKPDLEKKKVLELINKIQHKVDNILYLPELTGIACLGTELRHFFNEQTLAIEIKNNLDKKLNYVFKRIIDYIIALILLPFILIVMLFIAIIVKITSEGPSIIKQDRIGKGGRTFKCYKFRTMYIDAEERLKEILENDPAAKAEWEKYWKLKNDPRVTEVGRFLRKTSLDEIPQIFNVLKGEMSLIGPRPYLPREMDKLKDFKDIILSVPPGITGLWQTYGRNEKTYQERLLLDSWYVRNWNLWLDVVILLKTFNTVIKRKGAC